MGDLREEQLITTFGPGSIIDLKHFPVMIESSHKWLGTEGKEGNLSLQIHDLSIQTLVEKKLVDLTKGSIPIKKIKGLMRPPPEKNGFNELLGEVAKSISAIRFPQYHRCSRCNTLSKLASGEQQSKCEATTKNKSTGTYEKCGNTLEATRWVQICEDGHIFDFDWHGYLDCNGPNCGGEGNGESTIQYTDKATQGTFADITIRCIACGNHKSMGPAMRVKKKCDGRKIWSDNFKEQCGKDLKVVPRGKSSIYVSETLQGISLPQTNNFIELSINHTLYFNDVANNKDDVEGFIKFFNRAEADTNPFKSDQEVKEYYEWLKGHATENDFNELQKDYTKEEFKILTANDDINKEDFQSYQIELSSSSFLSQHFSSINKIPRVKILKCLLGFRRAFPNENENDTYGGKFQPVTIDNQYIPSVESFGEGIFFRFSDKKLKEVTTKNQFDNEVIIHSFSHFLMHELSRYSGYSITALSEKLYLHDENLGVLIYTSSGDSQCSMGGLSDLAEAHKLEQIILEGLENIKICSEDPFCINEKESCFSCIMTPEICCYLEPRRKNTALRRSCLTEIDGSKPYFTLS